MLNDEKIKELIKKNIGEDEIEGWYFYGVVTASIGKVMLLGNFASFANKYYIANFTNKKVDIYSLDMLGKISDYSYIPMSDIKTIKMSNCFLGIGKQITVEMSNGSKFKLKVNKHTIGLKAQKSNLIEMEKHFSTGKYQE